MNGAAGVDNTIRKKKKKTKPFACGFNKDNVTLLRKHFGDAMEAVDWQSLGLKKPMLSGLTFCDMVVHTKLKFFTAIEGGAGGTGATELTGDQIQWKQHAGKGRFRSLRPEWLGRNGTDANGSFAVEGLHPSFTKYPVIIVRDGGGRCEKTSVEWLVRRMEAPAAPAAAPAAPATPPAQIPAVVGGRITESGKYQIKRAESFSDGLSWGSAHTATVEVEDNGHIKIMLRAPNPECTTFKDGLWDVNSHFYPRTGLYGRYEGSEHLVKIISRVA